MNGKRLMWWSGMGICAIGVLLGAQVPYFYLHSKIAGDNLIRQAVTSLNKPSNQTLEQKGDLNITEFPLLPVLSGNTQTLPDSSSDSVLGLVHIPALHLTAPLLQGTSNEVLNVGVGHFTGSANPGMPGTCVIAAHNATWFRHLDALHPGDSIVLQTKDAEYDYQVASAKIVTVGDKVQNTARPSIVLEACYPLDALYLTSRRYLVTGELVSVTAKDGQSSLSMPTGSRYQALVPKDILQQGVTLSENKLPMGSLRFEGNPDLTYTESNAPLSAVYTMLQLYLSYVHASGSKNISVLDELLLPMAGSDGTVIWLDQQIRRDPFFGVQTKDILYKSNFDISLLLAGDVLKSATAATVVQVPNGRYKIKMNFLIKGNYFSIQSINLDKINL